MKSRPFVRRKNGVSTIVRDTYHTSSANGSWWDLVKQAVKRDGNKCGRCSYVGSGIERHHIVSLQDGGRNVLSNIISLCKTCHAKRHSHMFRRLIK
jgi:5-methylcytosine-specific restriction endonuclease McrA